jgi:hypothetical protein
MGRGGVRGVGVGLSARPHLHRPLHIRHLDGAGRVASRLDLQRRCGAGPGLMRRPLPSTTQQRPTVGRSPAEPPPTVLNSCPVTRWQGVPLLLSRSATSQASRRSGPQYRPDRAPRSACSAWWVLPEGVGEGGRQA